MSGRLIAATVVALACVGPCLATTDQSSNQLAVDIFKELVDINTTESVGNVTVAAEAMARRLRAAGFAAEDMQILGQSARKKNLVVRLRGLGKHRPVLLMGHLDVVEAKREDWSLDPFKFVEKDGYFYGRGTQDMKNGDAIMMAALIRLKEEGFQPSRDIILALTTDEETGSENGVAWLLAHHRKLVDAEFAINHDTNSITSDHGKPVSFEMDGTEKLYGDYALTTTNRGGHSSEPVPDNAIYELAAALMRVSAYRFPFELNNVTRAYYARMSGIEVGERAADMQAILKSPPEQQAIERLSQDPVDNSITHTTCVATRLEGGHANNALPQRARAIVNCRILPGHSLEEVRRNLITAVADPRIMVQYVDESGAALDKVPDRHSLPPPPLAPEVMQPLQAVVDQMWPGLKVVPAMAAGASDSVFTSAAGIPSYLVAGVAVDRGNDRSHGRDENLGVESFYRGNEFFYRFLKALTAQ